MVGYKKILGVLLLTTITGVTVAQNNTNSPYTRYGYGQLADQSFGNSKAMGGIAYGLRDGYHINVSNPASYTAIDSLTFLFDGGVTLQNTNFSDGTVKMNAKNSSFDYIAMQFRISKRLAMSAGFLPFSNVGYNINKAKQIDGNLSLGGYLTNFIGEGGLHQIYVGGGYQIADGFSVGANLSYLFGTINRSTNTYITNNEKPDVSYNEDLSIRDYKLDLGMQYTMNLSKIKSLTIGGVYSLGHKLNSTASSQFAGADMTPANSDFKMPQMFGVGLAYNYDKRLTVGLDYSFQQWSKGNYFGNELCDRSKYSIGAEFIPSPNKRSYLGRVKYRIGAFISDPYVKVADGFDANNNSIFNKGSREYGVTGGFGLPVFKSRSILSISAQYSKMNAKTSNMIGESYLKLSVGLTFNEAWFMKWKVE